VTNFITNVWGSGERRNDSWRLLVSLVLRFATRIELLGLLDSVLNPKLALPFNLGARVTRRIEINLFFEAGLYLMLFASSAGGV
jgi:hypothetical protein